MPRLRTIQNLLAPKKPKTLIELPIFFLENIGRCTYKNIFLLIKVIAKASYYALFAIVYFMRLVVRILILILRVIIKPKIKIPKVNIPTIKISPPKINAPKIKFKRPVIKLPVFKLPAIATLPKFTRFQIKINIKKILLLIFLTLGFGISLYFYIIILKDLPSPDKLITRDQIVSTKIYDRNANLLYTIYNGQQNRTLIKLSDIPNYVKQATIAIEDKDFYKHPGFSFRGIFRAIWTNLSNSGIQGGSTITQQLIKNTLLSPERTWERKIKELILSIQVELIFTKDEILQMYFNEVPFGGTAYGVEEAARTYFGKGVKDVSLAEGALLAGLPAAPTKYSPYGTNPQLAILRQHQVLDSMVENGFINETGAQEAKKQKIVLAPQTSDIRAPHFVMYVKDLLVEKYGIKTVEQGGLKVITSLDINIQEMAQQYVQEEIEKLTNMRVTNGAAIVTNPQTGEVLAMVGSRDYFDSQNDGNVNVTIMQRQIGSAIKPVTYSIALGNGYTPATIINDSPITYKIPGTEPYSPVNYDHQFHGNVTVRTALACSYNVPAVKTLATFGVNKFIDTAESMGITTWKDRSRFGLSLTLGAGEVKMTDMAVVYGVFANMGNRVDLHPVIEVTDYRGKSLNDFNSSVKTKVIDSRVAYLITDILKDNQARTPAFGPSSYLNIPNHEVAVKTGTTNDKRDNWTIGYTQDYLVAVWVGNNNNTPMSAVASGITGASPIWNHILSNLLKNKNKHEFVKAGDLVKVKICAINGLLACEGCPTKEEYFLSGTEPKQACNPEEIKKIKEEQEKAKQEKEQH